MSNFAGNFAVMGKMGGEKGQISFNIFELVEKVVISYLWSACNKIKKNKIHPLLCHGLVTVPFLPPHYPLNNFSLLPLHV